VAQLFSLGINMKVMLAEQMGGYLIVAGFLLAGIIASILALAAIVPAARGNRPLAIKLIFPASVVVFLSLCYVGAAFIVTTLHHEHFPLSDAFMLWLFVGALPFCTLALTALVLWIKRDRDV